MNEHITDIYFVQNIEYLFLFATFYYYQKCWQHHKSLYIFNAKPWFSLIRKHCIVFTAFLCHIHMSGMHNPLPVERDVIFLYIFGYKCTYFQSSRCKHRLDRKGVSLAVLCDAARMHHEWRHNESLFCSCNVHYWSTPCDNVPRLPFHYVRRSSTLRQFIISSQG